MTNQIEIKNDPKYRAVLNEGFVGLVDHMGDDSAIVQAARVSYGKGTKKISEDKGLIKYLVRHMHTTPLEMVTFKFHCKMPIFVARQWIRHRTASVNEYSGRYSEMSEHMYVPELEQIQPQATNNKQGRQEGNFSNEFTKESIQSRIHRNNEYSHFEYKLLLESGLAKEIARGILSVNNYTEWYWQINLHNLFHFLKLRLDKHAQYEIRVFAEAMYDLIKDIVPIACEAFGEYIFNFDDGNYQNYHLSRSELIGLRNILEFVKEQNPHLLQHVISEMKDQGGMSQREIDEFKKKFEIVS
jgi:thymidylate synthase (FAD)